MQQRLQHLSLQLFPLQVLQCPENITSATGFEKGRSLQDSGLGGVGTEYCWDLRHPGNTLLIGRRSLHSHRDNVLPPEQHQAQYSLLLSFSRLGRFRFQFPAEEMFPCRSSRQGAWLALNVLLANEFFTWTPRSRQGWHSCVCQRPWTAQWRYESPWGGTF